MPSLSGFINKLGGGSTGNNDRQDRRNAGALAGASVAVARQSNARDDRDNGRTGSRGGTLDETLDQAAVEREELRRFQQSVWYRVKDVDMLQLKPDSEEHKLAKTLEDRQKELGSERAEHQVRIDSLRKENDHRHAQAVEQERKNYQGHLSQIQNFHETNARNMEKKHRQDLANKEHNIAELNRLKGAEIRDLKDQLNRMKLNVEAAIKDRDDQLKALRGSHAIDIQNLEQKQSERAAEHESLLEATKKKHAGELSNLRGIHQEELDHLTAQHAMHTQGIRDQVQGLNNVLLKGDNDPLVASILSEAEIKKDADEKISAKFSEIVGLVDELGRMVWKPDQQIWTDQLLRKIGEQQNQRLLKKSILQDSIWTMLHLYVFCSPYRLFGNEGNWLENEWNTNYGEDPQFNNGVFTWPAMGIEAERWRYLTITGCRKALMKPPPSRYDPRVKLRDDFTNNKADLLLEFKSMFDAMVEYTPADAKRVDHLVTNIANIWLEFGMHRCRFILFMAGPNPKSITEKARQAEEGSLKLTVVPGLRRHGNVKGIDLGSATIVGGFEGVFVKLPGEKSAIDSE